MKNIIIFISLLLLGFHTRSYAQTARDQSLRKQQLDFVNLGFGMFIHYGMPTFMDQDWPDPDASPQLFNSPELNTDQWADAAKSANMRYGCLTTKHHSGFPIWDTKTTDYNVMNSPLGRDVVKEFTNSFRKKGLDVMLYYSILDTHHEIRPHAIEKSHIQLIKDQLTELLTNYGEINALVIDGWDAPWSRISYDEIPFDDIYYHIKSLQPNCLVMELNSAKYPGEALFYSDIKSYEQGAGQFISKEHNKLPAMACLPLQQNWFWKSNFPTTAVKDVTKLYNDFIAPYNQAYCNFMLNVAPNANGLMDDNALQALRALGQLYSQTPDYKELPEYHRPIVTENIAKHSYSNASWSDDMNIMDFANDDNFRSAWVSNPKLGSKPWYELTFPRSKYFNSIVITEDKDHPALYTLHYEKDGVWLPIEAELADQGSIKIFTFSNVIGKKIKIDISPKNEKAVIREVGVYLERQD